MEPTFFVDTKSSMSARFQIIKKAGSAAESSRLRANDRFTEIKLSQTERSRFDGLHGDACQGDVLDKYAKN